MVLGEYQKQNGRCPDVLLPVLGATYLSRVPPGHGKPVELVCDHRTNDRLPLFPFYQW